MEWNDEWLAPDKLQHVLACLLIAGRSSRSFLRRHALALGCAASLAVGTAKEASNEARFLGPSGASPKDAAADLLGTAIATVLVGLALRLRRQRRDKARDAGTADGDISMV